MQRKGNFNRKPAPKKTIGNKPAKKTKPVKDESMIDLSSMKSNKEVKPNTIANQKKQYVAPKIVVVKRSNYSGIEYKLTGVSSTGIVNRMIDRGNIVIHKGQCVTVFNTVNPNIVQVATMDGRKAYAPSDCFDKMRFGNTN